MSRHHDARIAARAIRQDRRSLLRAAGAGVIGYGGLAALAPAWGQARPDPAAAAAYPDRAVRIVVPYAAGGSSDTLGRLIALQLSNGFKQPVIVENRAGAGGTIGSQQVSKAPPDGYTLVVSGIGSHVIAPIDNKPYNPMTEFTHIAMLGGPPTAVAVNAAVPVNTLAELIAYAKQQSGGISWGSPGKGTHAHLLGELFWRRVGVNNTHIGYKGAAPAIADLVGGQIPVAFTTFTTANTQIRTGRVRGIAVTSEHRVAEYPQLPTFAELGHPQLTATTWFSLSGPAGMPPAIVDKINAEVRRGMKTEAARKVLATEAMETKDWDAATFTNYVRSEIERWQPLAVEVEKR